MTATSIWRTGGLTSSLRTDYATPRQLYEALDREFHFSLDVCADFETATCSEFFSQGALERRWVPLPPGSIWCNPPYGPRVGQWVEKACRESEFLSDDEAIVMLLPARTDTQWFHNYCLRGEIRFLRGRLCFDDRHLKRAPFPSMIVVFRRRGFVKLREV